MLRICFLPKLLSEEITILFVILGYQALLGVEARVLLLLEDLFTEFDLRWIIELPKAGIPKDQFVVYVVDKVAFDKPEQLMIQQVMCQFMRY